MGDEAPAPLTDLHTHILPGVDDGAADNAAALAMARAAVEDGIERVAATPHNLRLPHATNRAALDARVAALQRELDAAGLPLAVVAGAEIALIASLPQMLDAGEYVTLNRSRYLLLEPAHTGLPPRMEDLVFQVQVRGLAPILAHPERCAGLERALPLLRRLVERGLLVQITAGSLEGRFGPRPRRLARALLAKGLVHVIASDAHAPADRAPRLRGAEALAARLVGPERAHALVAANPAAILDDLPLEVEPPAPPPRRWFWQRGVKLPCSECLKEPRRTMGPRHVGYAHPWPRALRRAGNTGMRLGRSASPAAPSAPPVRLGTSHQARRRSRPGPRTRTCRPRPRRRSPPPRCPTAARPAGRASRLLLGGSAPGPAGSRGSGRTRPRDGCSSLCWHTGLPPN